VLGDEEGTLRELGGADAPARPGGTAEAIERAAAHVAAGEGVRAEAAELSSGIGAFSTAVRALRDATIADMDRDVAAAARKAGVKARRGGGGGGGGGRGKKREAGAGPGAAGGGGVGGRKKGRYATPA
jgi:hypothetical protein